MLRSFKIAALQRVHTSMCRTLKHFIDNVYPNTGEDVIVKPPEPTRTDYTESTAEWSYVERLLPPKTIPEPPKHGSYPTPSGWVPQRGDLAALPYFIKRTRYHNFPIYLETHAGGNRKMTVVKFIEGDIWAFEKDIRKYLQSNSQRQILTQVDEVCTKVRVHGICESNDGRRTPTADANIPSNITRRRMPPANDSNGSTIAKLINYARRRPMSGCYQNSDTQTSSPNYVSTVSNRPNSYDNAGEDLSKALWYHGGMSREVSMELLAQAEVGSFIVRDSTTHPNCYALSVKVPKYDNPSGVCHYLVIPASNGCGYTMKGLDKQWPSLSSLVAHHSIMAELLPCTLRMPQATDLRNAIQAELSPDTQRLAQAMEASNPSHLGEVNKQVATLHI